MMWKYIKVVKYISKTNTFELKTITNYNQSINYNLFIGGTLQHTIPIMLSKIILMIHTNNYHWPLRNTNQLKLATGNYYKKGNTKFVTHTPGESDTGRPHRSLYIPVQTTCHRQGRH